MKQPFRRWCWSCGLLLAVAGLVGLLTLTASKTAAQSQDDDTGPVAVKVVPRFPTIAPGDELVLAVVMDHPDRYHSWPNSEVKLSKSIDESAMRTEVGLAKNAPSGVKLLGVQWPEAHPGTVADPSGEKPVVTAPVFSGHTVIYLLLRTEPRVEPGELKIPVTVNYQSCDDNVCYQPKTLKFDVPVEVAAGAAKVPTDAPLFQGFDRASAAPAPSPAAGSAGAPATPSLLGVGLGGGLIVLFLASMLGGAVLNLTPCVLPIIPIKVMSLVEHAGTAHRRHVLGAWMAFGVVAFWAAMGLPMALFSSLDPTRLIFGTWWVTLSLGLVIALMGLGIMGLFSINLPQAAYLVSPKADTAKGSFFYGVMTGVLGLPCFGFVAGGLLVGSATLPPATIMIIFVGLGVGMAAPYLVLTIKPGLINKIPRTGPASELVKQVMGLLILAAAALFVASGVQTLLTEKPYVAGSMPYWGAAFFILLAGVWLTARTLMIAKTTWPRVVMPLASIACASLAIGYALISTLADRDSVWRAFSASRLAQAQDEHKVIVVDFTASWCVTCKALKRGVLDREPVITELRQPDVLPLEADVSSDTDPGWIKLKELGQTGVPTLAIFGPGLPKPLVYNAYTKDVVLKAIEQARGPRAVWQQFSEARLAEARSTNKVVVVNFTATWCSSYRAIKQTTLDQEPVVAELRQPDVLPLEADVSSASAPGWSTLKELGQTGVPALAIYGPALDKPLIYNAYSKETVLKAIEQARGARVTNRQGP